MKRTLPFLLATACLISTSTASTRVHAEEPERVIMGLDEFLDMYEKSKSKEEEQPPRDHAIASVRYDGSVLFEDDAPYAARFEAKIRVRALRKKGFARVPLLPATVAVESATIAGKDAPVVIEGGFYVLITDRRGDFDVDVVFGAGVKTAQGSSEISFQMVPAGATTLELAVPTKESLNFEVDNAKLKSDATVGDNRVVKATVPATGSLAIRWQRKVEEKDAPKKEARVYAEVYTLASLGDGVLRAKTSVQNSILFAGVQSFSYAVPKGMTVLDVSGPGIRSWKVANDKLDVQLNFAAEGAYALTVELERPMKKANDVEVPLLAPQGVDRARGWVGVEAAGNLEMSSGDVSGASSVDVRTLPGSILGVTDQPVLLGYKYLVADPAIHLTTAQHDEVDVLVTLLDQTVASTMWTREGRRLTSVRYQVRNNRRQFLKLTMPEGAELWSASVAGRSAQPARAGDGGVMVPLVRSQQAGDSLAPFEVEVVYVETGEPTKSSGRGTFTASLPKPDVPSTYVAWTVYSPDKTKVKRWSVESSLTRVKKQSFPIPFSKSYERTEGPEELTFAQQAMDEGGVANAPSAAAAMGRGAAPVMVSLPLQGEATHFEKTLALGEELRIEFDYRGLRQRRLR